MQGISRGSSIIMVVLVIRLYWYGHSDDDSSGKGSEIILGVVWWLYCGCGYVRIVVMVIALEWPS